MKRVCIYSRISTDLQDTKSQVDDLVKYCKTNNYEIVNIYQETMSGTIQSRDILDECVNFCIDENNNINELIVWELSRLHRKTLHLLNLVEVLKTNNINLYQYNNRQSLFNEDGSLNSTTNMMITFLGAFAENEREILLSRLHRTKLTRVLNGSWTGIYSNVTFGYHIVNDKIEIHKEESNIVKLIYKLYLDGVKVDDILNHLISKGIKTRQGKPFREKNTIYFILKNKMYNGFIHFRKSFLPMPQYKIIDDNTFQAVQDRLKKHRIIKPNAKKYNLLLDDINKKCGCCGLSYSPKIIEANNTETYYCLGKNKLEKCENNGISINKVDSALYYILRRDSQIKKRYNDIIEASNPQIKIEGLRSDLNRFEVLINQCKARIERNNELYIDGRYNKQEYNNRVQILENEILKYNNDIKRLNREIISIENLSDKKYTVNDYFIELKGSKQRLKNTFNDLISKVVFNPLNENPFSNHKLDKAMVLEVYLFNDESKPIQVVISQRTNKIIILPNIYDFKTHSNKTLKGLKINDIRHFVNYDDLND